MLVGVIEILIGVEMMNLILSMLVRVMGILIVVEMMNLTLLLLHTDLTIQVVLLVFLSVFQVMFRH